MVVFIVASVKILSMTLTLMLSVDKMTSKSCINHTVRMNLYNKGSLPLSLDLVSRAPVNYSAWEPSVEEIKLLRQNPKRRKLEPGSSVGTWPLSTIIIILKSLFVVYTCTPGYPIYHSIILLSHYPFSLNHLPLN